VVSFNPDRFAPGSHWIGGWVDPRAVLDDVDKRKFLNSKFDPSAVQPVASRYPGSFAEVSSQGLL
jgi:hypothetical protein